MRIETLAKSLINVISQNHWSYILWLLSRGGMYFSLLSLGEEHFYSLVVSYKLTVYIKKNRTQLSNPSNLLMAILGNVSFIHQGDSWPHHSHGKFLSLICSRWGIGHRFSRFLFNFVLRWYKLGNTQMNEKLCAICLLFLRITSKGTPRSFKWKIRRNKIQWVTQSIFYPLLFNVRCMVIFNHMLPLKEMKRIETPEIISTRV